MTEHHREPRMPPAAAPVLVACCGNGLAGDDALGELVAERLQQRDPPGAAVLNLSIDPTRLIDHLSGRSMLIIVDAIMWPGHAPGECIDIDWRDPARPALQSQTHASTHGLGIAEQLALAERLDLLPPGVRLIGVTSASCRIGEPLSIDVAASVDRVIQQIVMHCGRQAEEMRYNDTSTPPHPRANQSA